MNITKLFSAYNQLKNQTMSDDIMNFDLPVERSSIIKVLGIGGGGNNAVNHMFEKGIKDVNFVVWLPAIAPRISSPGWMPIDSDGVPLSTSTI